MTKNDRIRNLRVEFKKLFVKLERLLKTTSRENEINEIIDIIQLCYFVYHRINDNLKIVNKL